MVSGAPKLIQEGGDNLIEVALEEIVEGKVSPGKKEDIPPEEASADAGQEKEPAEEKKKAENKKPGEEKK